MKGTLRSGEEAPDFQAAAVGPQEGGGSKETAFHLSGERGKRVALCFFPFEEVPAAKEQLGALRDAARRGAFGEGVLVGISRDSAENHHRLVAELGLPFALLTDTDHHIAKAYGVWLGEGGGGDIEGGSLTRRATFVVNAQGTIEAVVLGARVSDHIDGLAALFNG